MKRTIIALIAVVAILVCAGESQAGGWSTKVEAVIYKITINKVRMWDGTDWHVAFTGNTEYTITSVSSGASCGNYCTNVELPDGTYTQMEITMSRTISIKATALYPETSPDELTGTHYTTTTTAGGSIKCSMNLLDYALGTAIVQTPPAGWTFTDSYMYRVYTLSSSIVITSGTTQTMRISFATLEAATFTLTGDPGDETIVCSPSDPIITITQIE